MDIRKLQHHIVDALEDVKAQDIQVFDTTQLTSLFDRVIVASGTSNRQTKALATSVREKVKSSGGYIASVEGEDVGEWVLVDCGDAIVHVMQPAIRQYYRLEEIWGGKSVDVKREYKAFVEEGSPDKPAKATKRKALKKAEAKDAEKQPVKKAPAKKAAAKPTAKPVAKSKAKPASNPAVAKRPPANAPTKKVAAKKAPAKSAVRSAAKPASKPATKPASKPLTKKAAGAAKKLAGKAAPAKRPATKKAY
jgi:ribosome-associated protein